MGRRLANGGDVSTCIIRIVELAPRHRSACQTAQGIVGVLLFFLLHDLPQFVVNKPILLEQDTLGILIPQAKQLSGGIVLAVFHGAIWSFGSDQAVVFIIGITGDATCPVGYGCQLVCKIVRILKPFPIRVDQVRQPAACIIRVAQRLDKIFYFRSSPKLLS